MKHYLVRTLFYGIGAGICIPLSVIVNIYFVALFALILIVFLITEMPRTNSGIPDAKSQKRDKIWLFILLALSGVGLYSIYVTFGILLLFFDVGGGDSAFTVLLFTGPIAFIYLFFAITVLSRVFGPRSNKVSLSVTKSSDEESTEYLPEENFSKLTYRQRLAVIEYGYLLSPENAETVGKMLGNFHEKDVLPFCQANGKRISSVEE